MKNKYRKLTGLGWLVMLMSTVSLAFVSQAQMVSPPQIQWQRTIEKNALFPAGYSPPDKRPVRIVKLDNQEYGLLTSGSELVRLSSAGNVIWSTLIVNANSGYFQTDGVIATQDGGLIVLALTTGNWRLIKYNANGVVERTYSPFSAGTRRQFSTSRSDLIATSDNGILVIGNRWDMLEGKITVVVAKFNSNISQSWENEISFPLPNLPVESDDYTNSVKAINTPDGGYLLVGSNGRTVKGPTAGWAVKLDGQGNQIWQKRYEDIFAIDDVIQSPFNADTYITIGRSANDPSLTQITTISSNGNVVEKFIQPGRATGTSSALIAVPKTNETPAYLTLMDVSSQNNGDIRLTAVNARNEVQWTKTVGGSAKEQEQAILATDDGGYIAVGTTTSTDGDITGKTTSDVATWVVKLGAPVSVPTSTLKLIQPTYNCTTGGIIFNTVGGDGSPITYTAPGITRSSPTSNTGVVEQGLRNDPKPILIQATQSGYTASYTFDLVSYCTYEFKPPVLVKPIPDMVFAVGQTLKQDDFYLGNYIVDPTPDQPHYFPGWTASIKGLPTGINQSSFGDLQHNLSVSLAGAPTVSGVYTVTVTAATHYFENQPVITTFNITVTDNPVTPPTEGTLTLTLPTYDCATGAITFNTTGGDRTLITYTAPGISRSSVTSNTGVVEQGLRNDPKPITIQATQSGYTTSYTFDLKAYCSSRQPSPVYATVQDRTLQVEQVLAGYEFLIGQGYYNPSDPYNYKNWSIAAIGLPPGLVLSTDVSSSSYFAVVISGKTTTAGVYPVTVTAVDPQFPNDTPYTTRFTITVVNPAANGLSLLAPTYDCATGAITFKTAGGDGSPIEFRAIGITDWTTNPDQFVDRESRTANDVQPFTLMARQSGQVVMYTWDLKAACGRARVGIAESGKELSLQLLGNPVQDRVRVQIRGAEGQSIQLRLTDVQGRLLESRTLEQAQSVEDQQFWLNASAPKLLLLQAATPHQAQTVKIIRQ